MTRIGNTLVYVSSELHTIVLWLGELQFNGKLGSTAIASLQHVFPHKLCIHQPMNVYLSTLVGLSNGNTYWWTGLALLCFSWLYVAFIICCSSVHVSTQIGPSQSQYNDQLVGRWRTWTWTTKYLPSRTKQLASTPRLSCDKPGKRVYKDTQAIGRNIMCYNNLQKWIVVAIILLISLSLSFILSCRFLWTVYHGNSSRIHSWLRATHITLPSVVAKWRPVQGSVNLLWV